VTMGLVLTFVLGVQSIWWEWMARSANVWDMQKLNTFSPTVRRKMPFVMLNIAPYATSPCSEEACLPPPRVTLISIRTGLCFSSAAESTGSSESLRVQAAVDGGGGIGVGGCAEGEVRVFARAVEGSVADSTLPRVDKCALLTLLVSVQADQQC